MAFRLAQRVLLVGWDAADWRVITPLLDSGQLPCLERLIDNGVMGNLATLEPILSPMLWNSIATGKRADKHGVLGFVEPDPASGSIRPVASTTRKVKAIWNILSQSGLRTHVFGWYASHPAEPINGVCVSNLYAVPAGAHEEPWPMPPGTVHPERLVGALAALRVHPGDLTGEHLLPFVPEAARIDQNRDRRLEVLAKILAESVSIHAAATSVIENEPWDFLALYQNTIDHMSHAFMAYHPPRQEHIPEEDFDLYKDVVAGCYRFHDMMLDRLLQLAGPETTVMIVSDHGFHSDHLRPRGRTSGERDRALDPTAWHRLQGIVCLAGPHIKQDAVIHGASLLDVTPTVLTLFGLPVGEDMEGRPMLTAFEDTLAPERIASWEAVAGESGMHSPDRREDPWDSREVLDRLVALGYVDAPGEDERQAVATVRRIQRSNLARVHLEAGRPAEAASLLDELLQGEPDDDTHALYLAQCHHELGHREECRRLVDGILERGRDRPVAELLLGSLALAEDQADEALAILLRAEQEREQPPNLQCMIGRAYLKLRRWEEAGHAFGKALDLDPDCVFAHLGVAMACYARRRLEDAADAALNAVGLQYHSPLGHLGLGVILARLGRPARAIQALETSLALRPGLVSAHHWLALIYEQSTRNPAKAAEHRRLAGELSVAGP